MRDVNAREEEEEAAAAWLDASPSSSATSSTVVDVNRGGGSAADSVAAGILMSWKSKMQANLVQRDFYESQIRFIRDGYLLVSLALIPPRVT